MRIEIAQEMDPSLAGNDVLGRELTVCTTHPMAYTLFSRALWFSERWMKNTD